MDCFERWPKGWAFLGESMPARRILCYSRSASRTVLVSVSAMANPVTADRKALEYRQRHSRNCPLFSRVAANTRHVPSSYNGLGNFVEAWH